jgi:hypothetical protein
MGQRIAGFSENYGATETDTSVKALTYYDQKQLLAQSFGTAKAQRKLASVLTNRVDDAPELDKNGQPTKRKKGARDSRLQPMAESVHQKQETIKKENATASQRRKVLYGKEILMP